MSALNPVRSFFYLLFITTWLYLPACNSTGKKEKTSHTGGGPELVLQIEYLDRMVLENSGLVWYRDKLWTINDSGGDPVLFAIDMRTGRCIQALFLVGAENRDWEELAQDEDYIYVLDTGNNFGRRDELTIYKVSKDSIPMSGNARVQPEIIQYHYGDKETKTGRFTRSPYDCEAAFAWRDSLYLFTKDWENQQTDLYICPAHPGPEAYTLWPAATFEADGLITGADVSPTDSSLVILLGYKEYVPFVWELHGFDFRTLSMESTRRIDFPEKYDLQTEGIAILPDNRVYISCEMSSWPASVYSLKPGKHIP
jgi:hypothetical protein